MIDLKQMKQWRDGCGFQHRLLTQSSRVRKESKPKEVTIDKVLHCIKIHKTIIKKVIIHKTKVSGPTLDKCIDALLRRGEITSHYIGMSGPYKTFSYSVVKDA